MTPTDAPLRAQHRPSTPENGRGAGNGGANGLCHVRKAPPGTAVGVTVRLGLAPNSLAFWRRRRFGTAAAFATALSDAPGLHITAAHALLGDGDRRPAGCGGRGRGAAPRDTADSHLDAGAIAGWSMSRDG